MTNPLKIYNVQFFHMGVRMGGLVLAKDIDDVVYNVYKSFRPKVPSPGIIIRSVIEMKEE